LLQLDDQQQQKGPKPNNINMEVDVDVVICSTTKANAQNLATLIWKLVLMLQLNQQQK
jgi:hypothetical protein